MIFHHNMVVNVVWQIVRQNDNMAQNDEEQTEENNVIRDPWSRANNMVSHVAKRSKNNHSRIVRGVGRLINNSIQKPEKKGGCGHH